VRRLVRRTAAQDRHRYAWVPSRSASSEPQVRRLSWTGFAEPGSGDPSVPVAVEVPPSIGVP